MGVLDSFIGWLEEDGKERKDSPNYSLLRIVENLGHAGRGLISKVAITSGSCCLSIPISDPRLILTPNRCVDYLNRCGCFKRIPSSIPNGAVEPLDCLVLFLFHIAQTNCCPLYKTWEPYLRVLPKTYTDPVFSAYTFPGEFPAKFNSTDLNTRFHQIRRRLLRSWHDIQHLIVNDTFSQDTPPERFLWAWCSVNSRCVYCPLPESGRNVRPNFVDRLRLDKISSSSVLTVRSSPNVISADVALIPFFDFFNHDAAAQCKLVVDDSENAVKLFLHQSFAAGKQVFINYGPHDNLTLLLEYGFCVDSDENPHDAVYPGVADIESVVPASVRGYLIDIIAYLGVKESSGPDHSVIWPTICFTQTGASLHLLLLLHVLCMLQTEQGNGAEKVLKNLDWKELYQLDEYALVRQLRPLLVQLVNKLVEQQQSDDMQISDLLKNSTHKATLAATDGLVALKRFFHVRKKLLDGVYMTLLE